MVSPMAAGWPHSVVTDLPLHDGRPSAAAMDAGMTRQAVLANSTAPFFRAEVDGSAMRNTPTSVAFMLIVKSWLGPAPLVTVIVAVPDSGSSEGRTRLIWPRDGNT